MVKNLISYMVTIRRIQTGEAELYRQVRLAALRKSPAAFSSTYAGALKRSATSWSEQVDRTAQGPDRATFILFCGDTPAGLAALYREQEGSTTGELLQVWVSPEQRGGEAAAALLDAVFGWAGENGFRRVLASVKQGNSRALGFYYKYGFTLASEPPREDQEILLEKEV